MIFFMAGLCFKISLVPFHLGPPTLTREPDSPFQRIFLSCQRSRSLCFHVYSLESIQLQFSPEISESWKNIIWWIIVITITVGNIFAIRQNNLKRFLAFSSISQAGYIMLGVIAGTDNGMGSMIYYILVYLFTNLAAFGVISDIENQTAK